MRWGLALLVYALFAAAPAAAVNPDEILDDPVLESRARDISAGLRCLVCQNQSIDDSDAPLARDLRMIVRERLLKGETNAEIIDFVVGVYGEFVLLKPRLNPNTWGLWLAPPIVLGFGILGVWGVFRARARRPEPALSADEEQRLARFLENDEKDPV